MKNKRFDDREPLQPKWHLPAVIGLYIAVGIYFLTRSLVLGA